MTTVLCNAGPLIVLGKLNRLELLAGALWTGAAPAGGIRRGGDERSGARSARCVHDPGCSGRRKTGLSSMSPAAILAAYKPSVILDPGETEVLALARTLPDALVLLDDETARAQARRLKLRVRGTLGVLTQAYRSKILSFPEVELLLQEIAARPDIWIGARLCEQVLQALRES